MCFSVMSVDSIRYLDIAFIAMQLGRKVKKKCWIKMDETWIPTPSFCVVSMTFKNNETYCIISNEVSNLQFIETKLWKRLKKCLWEIWKEDTFGYFCILWGHDLLYTRPNIFPTENRVRYVESIWNQIKMLSVFSYVSRIRDKEITFFEKILGEIWAPPPFWC